MRSASRSRLSFNTFLNIVYNPCMTKRIKRKGRFWVYIVECNDGTYYTGYTPNIERRIKLHNSGRGAKYTRDRRPVELVWSKEYKYFKSAFLEEKRIKRLERKEKEGLVRQGRRSSYPQITNY